MEIEKEAKAKSPTVRATVPLFYIDFEAVGRIPLAPDVTLAELSAREAERVRSSHSTYIESQAAPLFRLEVLFDSPEAGLAELEVGERVYREAVQLLTCVSNVQPAWFSIPVDRYSQDSNSWIRSSLNYSSGGHRPPDMWKRAEPIQNFFGYAHFRDDDQWFVSEQLLNRWSEALKNWPRKSSPTRMSVALDYLAQSIADLMLDERKALLSVAVCLESMFGEHTELKYRTSNRLAHLLATGDEAIAVFEKAKRWYDARSKLVHTGRTPISTLTVEAITHLRRGLFAMERLIEIAGGHDAALAVLDCASFVQVDELIKLHDEPEDAWWRLPELVYDGSPVKRPSGNILRLGDHGEKALIGPQRESTQS